MDRDERTSVTTVKAYPVPRASTKLLLGLARENERREFELPIE